MLYACVIFDVMGNLEKLLAFRVTKQGLRASQEFGKRTLYFNILAKRKKLF
jgi:hypothetical protein